MNDTKQNNEYIHCRRCGSAITPVYKQCPYCGYKFNKIIYKSKRLYDKINKKYLLATSIISTFISFIFILFVILLTNENLKFENNLNDTKQQLESTTADYNSAIEENSNLSSKNTDLRNENSDLQSSFDELQEKYEALEEEKESLEQQLEEAEEEEESTSSSGMRIPEAFNDENDYSETVYWTPGGEVYHYSRNCSTLKRSSTIRSGSISSSGKSRACKVCG